MTVTPMLMKMSNSLKELNFQLSALAKLVLQFQVHRTALRAFCRRVRRSRFAEEPSFDELPVKVRDHLDSAAVLLEKV